RLHTAGAGADDRHTFIRKLVQHRMPSIATGVCIVPTRRMEGLALEVPQALDAGQLRRIRGTRTHDDESRADIIAAVGTYTPARDRLVPAQREYPCVEQRALVKIEFGRDALELLVYFPAVGELLGRNVAGLFQ